MKIEIEVDEYIEKLTKAYRDGFEAGIKSNPSILTATNPNTTNPTVTWGPGIRDIPVNYKDILTKEFVDFTTITKED